MLCVMGVPSTTKKNLKISILGVRGSADLIDFNHFCKVVLIDGGLMEPRRDSLLKMLHHRELRETRR